VLVPNDRRELVKRKLVSKFDRFLLEQPRLTPLPERRFVGTTTLTRKVSSDCLVPYQGNHYSVPAVYAGKMVWLLVSHGTHLVILNSRRELLAEHELNPGHGQLVMVEEHYAPLRRRGSPPDLRCPGRSLLGALSPPRPLRPPQQPRRRRRQPQLVPAAAAAAACCDINERLAGRSARNLASPRAHCRHGDDR